MSQLYNVSGYQQLLPKNLLSYIPAITALVDATAGMILFTTPVAQIEKKKPSVKFQHTSADTVNMTAVCYHGEKCISSTKRRI